MTDRAEYDYVIVGAGAAGCVLAYRLTEDPKVKVALLEAGGGDRHPFFKVPKAVPLLMNRPKSLWTYPTKPEESNANKEEYWLRGKVMGGSTSVNGLMWVRGQPADFDAIAELSSDDWGWKHIGPAYAALEHHELGAGQDRGGDGPLKVSLPGTDVRMAWHDAVIAAGHSMGLPVKEDVNAPDNDEGVGYNPRTIWKGERQSASVAYLAPARKRRNLTVISGATVDKVLFRDKKAVGVQYLKNGQPSVVGGAEIILCGGAMASPGILERSGIGDPDRLKALGIDVVAARPQVGEHMIEHRALLMQWKMANPADSYNRAHRGLRLIWTTLRYLLTKKGPMTSATFDMGAWLKSRPGLNRPDTQFLIAPHSLDFTKMGKTTEPFPGMSLVVYPLRPESAGSVHITSTNPAGVPETIANHRATDLDKRAMIDGVRAARTFTAQAPLKDMIVAETQPGAQYQSDEEILQAYDLYATCGYHTVGTCRMGNDPDSVVDPELRVRGVEGLRVIDTSIMPVMPSGNTQGPTMAMAWRAADVIRHGAGAR